MGLRGSGGRWCWSRSQSGSDSNGIKGCVRGDSSGSWPRAREGQACAQEPHWEQQDKKMVVVV
jgi:hypothetical protein